MQPQPPRSSNRRFVSFLCVLFGLLWISACSPLPDEPLPTPIPSDYLPTAVALTVQAGRPPSTPTPEERTQDTPEAAPQTPTDQPAPSATLSPTVAATRRPSATPTVSPTGPSPTPYTPPPSPTSTPTPAIPNAEIEIRNLGPLARVTSPLHVYLYMKPGAGGKVLIELLGEDQRMLYREIRKIDFAPIGAWATFTLDIDYEVAVAEAGRLKISVADDFGRTVALNSVPLILLSVGDSDIVPPQDVLAPIIIRQPKKKALIQGGKLVVSGLARPEGGPLMIKLLTTKGNEVGFRLAEVGAPGEGGYGEFAIEVPYSVSEPTPALLVVLEGGESLADVIHLSSLEVLLSP